jgi:hypothetical protein
MRLTYLIGQPGVGKSTLLQSLTEGVPRYASYAQFAKSIYPTAEAVQLGEERPPFSGTDTLSMSVQPKVLEWARVPDFTDILGEGDRLSTGSFFEKMQGLGYDLCIVHCYAPTEVAAERRGQRAVANRLKPQDPKWVKGRLTKVEKLASAWATHFLDMDRPLSEVMLDAMRLPILDSLWEARP